VKVCNQEIAHRWPLRRFRQSLPAAGGTAGNGLV